MKYYSEKLKKLFDAEKDLVKAEKEFDEKMLVEKKEQETKKLESTKVTNAYALYIKTKEEADKKVNDTYNDYIKLRNEFVKKYGSFHMTYSSPASELTTNYCQSLESPLTELMNFLTGR